MALQQQFCYSCRGAEIAVDLEQVVLLSRSTGVARQEVEKIGAGVIGQQPVEGGLSKFAVMQPGRPGRLPSAAPAHVA